MSALATTGRDLAAALAKIALSGSVRDAARARAEEIADDLRGLGAFVAIAESREGIILVSARPAEDAS